MLDINLAFKNAGKHSVHVQYGAGMNSWALQLHMSAYVSCRSKCWAEQCIYHQWIGLWAWCVSSEHIERTSTTEHRLLEEALEL